MIKTKRSYCSK